MKCNTKQFTYDAKLKCFITEASNLELRYPDSILALTSQKTGVVSYWDLNKTEYTNDEDHELVAWHYTPAQSTLRCHPGLKGHIVTIFND